MRQRREIKKGEFVLWLFCLCFLIGTMSGCGKNKEKEVVGVYISQESSLEKGIVFTYELTKDGQFTASYYNHVVKKDDGTWETELKESDTGVWYIEEDYIFFAASGHDVYYSKILGNETLALMSESDGAAEIIVKTTLPDLKENYGIEPGMND